MLAASGRIKALVGDVNTIAANKNINIWPIQSENHRNTCTFLSLFILIFLSFLDASLQFPLFSADLWPRKYMAKGQLPPTDVVLCQYMANSDRLNVRHRPAILLLVLVLAQHTRRSQWAKSSTFTSATFGIASSSTKELPRDAIWM